jgi:amino-acid N-acetyltransferase
MSETVKVPDRVNAIREVIGYLGRYRDELFVLKIDDSLLDEPLFSLLVRDVVLLYRMGIRVVIVPGARRTIDATLAAAGFRSTSHDGIRITTEEELTHVMMAASRVSNRILSLLSENGAQAVSGNWVRARTLGVIGGIDYQRTGRIERVNVPLLTKLLGEGVIPLVTNIGWNAVGKAYNISSTELAVAVACAMGAAKLFFIGTQPGIPASEAALPDVRVRENGVYSNMDLSQVEKLLAAAGGSMEREHRVLLQSAVTACTGGVKRVHIVDGRENGILLEEIFSVSGRGTMLFANLYTNICPATVEDVPEIIRLIQPFIQQSLLVQRTPEVIAEGVERWVVYKVDDAIRGCAALTPYDAESGEIEALVVDEDHRSGGAGGRIVSFLLDRAQRLGLKRVFALTTQASDFFMALGFREVSSDALPQAKRTRYNRARNSRVLAMDVSAQGIAGGGP